MKTKTKKKFDVLKWIRDVRTNAYYERKKDPIAFKKRRQEVVERMKKDFPRTNFKTA